MPAIPAARADGNGNVVFGLNIAPQDRYYDEIINCVAHTKTYDEKIDKHWATNFEAVSYLTDFCIFYSDAI